MHYQNVVTAPLIPSQKTAGEIHYISSPVHFISSHYTGTAHVCAETRSEPSRSPPPSYDDSIIPEAMADTLRQNSINPSALLPNQVQLFVHADYEQRLRLLELWRIAPPVWPLEHHLRATKYGTSLEQEEQAAMIRYEQQMQARSMQPEEHMLDTHIVDVSASSRSSAPLSPIRGPGETAWPPAARMRAASISAAFTSNKAEAEPYIVNGYQSTDGLHRQAVDPVYAADPQLWQAPSYALAQQQHSSEANQGQLRNHADWERLNQEVMRERFVGLHDPMDDDDMIM